MILFLLFGGFFIPLLMLPSTPTKLRVGAFWVQFGMQGATGVIPIWLFELSPPGFLAFFLGVVAQVGTVSSYLFFYFHDWPISSLRCINRCWDPDLGKSKLSWLEQKTLKRRSSIMGKALLCLASRQRCASLPAFVFFSLCSSLSWRPSTSHVLLA